MDRIIYNTGFGIIPKSVMQDPNLSIEAKGIFCYIATYANSEGMAFPSRDLICYHLGIGKNRYTKYMQELKEKGYIEVTQVKEGNKFAHNLYKLIPCPQNRDTQIEDTQNETLTIPVNNNTNNKNNKEPRHKYGEYKNILLTDKELEKLISDYGKPIIDEYIKKMDEWIELNGKRYKNYNLALRKWLGNANIKPTKKETSNSVNQFSDFIPENVKNVVDDELERIKKLRG